MQQRLLKTLRQCDRLCATKSPQTYGTFLPEVSTQLNPCHLISLKVNRRLHQHLPAGLSKYNEACTIENVVSPMGVSYTWVHVDLQKCHKRVPKLIPLISSQHVSTTRTSLRTPAFPNSSFLNTVKAVLECFQIFRSGRKKY